MKHPFLVTRACIDSTRIGEEMAVYMNHFTLSILPPPLLLYFTRCSGTDCLI